MPKQIKCFQAADSSQKLLCQCALSLFPLHTGLWCYVPAEALGAFAEDCDHIP